MSFGVFSASVKAQEIETLRFTAYYYTINPETLYTNQWTTESGQGIHKVIDMPDNSHVTYCFLRIYGFKAGSSYNMSIQKVRINNSFTLKQAYIQGSERNIDIMESFSGNASTGYTGNFDVQWSEGASQIILYFENPNTSTVIDQLQYDATYINAANIGNGQATAVGDIQNNTTDIKTDTGNIFTSILELPQKIYDKMLDLLEYVFIPDPDQMKAIMDDFNDYIEGRLGFLGESFDYVVNFYRNLKTYGGNSTINFPEMSITLQGTKYVLYSGGNIYLSGIVGNKWNDFITPCRTITSILLVLAVLNMCIHELSAFLGNRQEL